MDLRKRVKVGKKLTIEDCKLILQRLQENEHAWPFTEPFDAHKIGLDNYYEIVKKPMDFATLLRRLENSNYTVEQFLKEIQLIWQNTYLYCRKHSPVYEYAAELEQEFIKRKRLFEEGYGVGEPSSKQSDVCGVCNEGGELLICDGDCLQAFHLPCVNLISEPNTPLWFCNKCRKKFKGALPSTTAQARLMKLSFLYDKAYRNPYPPGTSASSQSVQEQPFVLFKKNPPLTPISVPWRAHATHPPSPFTVSPIAEAVAKYRAMDPQVHLKLEMPIEEKLKRRKCEESQRLGLMAYDPFWCTWRPKIAKRDYIEKLNKVMATVPNPMIDNQSSNNK